MLDPWHADAFVEAFGRRRRNEKERTLVARILTASRDEVRADAAALVPAIDGKIAAVAAVGEIGNATRYADQPAVHFVVTRDYNEVGPLEHLRDTAPVVHGPTLGKARALEYVDEVVAVQV